MPELLVEIAAALLLTAVGAGAGLLFFRCRCAAARKSR